MPPVLDPATALLRPAADGGGGRQWSWLRAERAARLAVAGAGLATSPAWDVMIEIALARHFGMPAYVSGIAAGLGIAPSSAVRHIALLEARGLVRRKRDYDDGRRVRVKLEPAGKDLVARYIEQLNYLLAASPVTPTGVTVAAPPMRPAPEGVGKT